jgi:hypothetical protein
MAGIVKSTNPRNDSSHLNLEPWFRSFLSANLFSETNKEASNPPSDLGHHNGGPRLIGAEYARYSSERCKKQRL